MTIAVLYALPALIWGVLTYNYVVLIRTVLPTKRLFWLFPVWSGVACFIYVVLAVGELTEPVAGVSVHRILVALIAFGIVALGAVLRHLIVLMTGFVVNDEPATGRWLAGNYGSAALVAAVILLALLAHDPPWTVPWTIAPAYLVLASCAAGWQVRARIRGGRVRVGSLATQVHHVDIAVFVIVGLVIVTLVLAALAGADGLGIPLALVAIGVLGAVPAALRNVTAVVRDVVITVATIGAAGGIYFGARAAGASLGEVPRRLVDLGALLGLVLLLVPGRSWLQGALDRVILRHTRRVRSDLQDFLHTLSPELGTVECCRRALAHLARAYRLRGAAVLLHDGTALVEGDLSLEPLRAVWPTGALADLPSQPFMWLSLDDVRLRRALAAADVAGVLPIVSPRRRWGHLFTSIGIFGWDKSAEQVEAGAAFCDQLARVLDAAELLARAIAFERSLAHAEKLAAIGETAARIAHDIRNPITAARSLAQQLAREPAAPFKAEHHVIPGELERVERQVAALLQFARRDELHLAAVDLGVLVGATAAAFRPRLEAAGISLELTLADALTARADAEKLRQAVVNLIENAVDALAGRAAKRLAVDVASTNGRASIAITDSGPGVPADALPHVFEPFFSLKEHGTGLGLAIARRTAEAHGGTIEAAAAPGGGMTFRLRLPLA